MAFGSNGAILRVDLTSGTTSVETFDEAFYRRYPGGKALAAYHLPARHACRRGPAWPGQRARPRRRPADGRSGVDRHPLQRDRPLAADGRASASPRRAGTGARSSRWRASTPSSSRGVRPSPPGSGSRTAPRRSATPARCGARTHPPCRRSIEEAVGEKNARVLQIGRAGENLVPYAMLMNDLRHYNGRTGHGRRDGLQERPGDRRQGVAPVRGPRARSGGARGARQAALQVHPRPSPGLGPADQGHAGPDRRAQRGGHPADTQLPRGLVRAGRADRLARVRGDPERHPLLLRVCRPLQAGDGVRGRAVQRHRHLRRAGVRGDRGVRLELRHLRPRARGSRQRAVQRDGDRRHLGRGHRRVRHGVRGARAARRRA